MKNPRKTQLVEYIQRSIADVCPYENEHLKRLYHIGFLSSLLADLMYSDSKYFDKFNHRVKTLNKRKEEL